MPIACAVKVRVSPVAVIRDRKVHDFVHILADARCRALNLTKGRG